MDDSNQKSTTNDPYIQPTGSPLNPAAQQVGPSPQSINPEVIIAQPQSTVSVVSPSVVTGSPAPNPTKSKKNLFIIIGVVVIILIALALYFFVFHKSKTPTNGTTSVQSTNQSSSRGSDNVANGVSVASTFLNDATHNEASSAWNLLEPQTATALNETQSQFTQNVQQLSTAFTGQIKELNSKQSQLPAQDGQEIPMLDVSFSLDLKGQSAGSDITESYISKANGGNNTWEVDYATFTNYSFINGYSTSNQL